ncbi:hypothetical protein GGR92_004365 [Spirosoma lacussanchae]|uniref:hypothetical protein n=1 Tax=Spirosoma lacussanchae TaxID=1884249 RepID=UPI001107EF82|nr:hypothetical protein [Spirosoma lacussanchae]
MNKRRSGNPIWHRLFCLLMAFYVINVSIDAPDGYVTPNSRGEYREDLSFNEIESFSELVLETIFGIQDAVPEHDESDEEEDQVSKIFVDWSVPGPVVMYEFAASAGFVTVPVQAFTHTIYRSRSTDINTPPPQIA